jgi:hypothetical protein
MKAGSTDDNIIEYLIELQSDSMHMNLEGTFSVSYEGITGNFIKRRFLNHSDRETLTIAKKHYSSVFSDQTISNLMIDNRKGKLVTDAELTVKGKIFDIDDKRLLFIDFLPGILENLDRDQLIEGMYIGNTIGKKVKLRIVLDRSFEAFPAITHLFKENGVELSVEISNPTDRTIICIYKFDMKHITIDKTNLNIINEILKSFKNLINEPIILKLQS